MTALRLTDDEFTAIRNRIAAGSVLHSEQSAGPEAPEPRSRYRSKTEAEYALVLRARQANGEIIWHEYEPIKLRLADNTTYTPDFLVKTASGILEFHEVKGFWRPQAWIKFKWAVDRYSALFKFVVVKKKKGEWYYERF